MKKELRDDIFEIRFFFLFFFVIRIESKKPVLFVRHPSIDTKWSISQVAVLAILFVSGADLNQGSMTLERSAFEGRTVQCAQSGIDRTGDRTEQGII